MKRILLFIAGITLLFSCEENSSLTTISTEVTSDYLRTGTLDTYIQNNQIVRLKGKPGVTTVQVGTADLSKYEPCFILYIATGTTQATTVSSAIIKLDGLEVLNTSDFSKNTAQRTFEVCNLTSTSVLTVEVRGEPGSYVDIWIEGKLKGLTDKDGNIYKTVTIGNQIWMAENLKTTKYNDGIGIDNVIDINKWNSLTTGAYCWYNNDIETYKDSYGALYNWYAVNTQKLCPAGWHVPTDEEWAILISFLGGESTAADKLKEVGTLHWLMADPNVTNVSGFTGLPGGYRSGSGFFGLGDFGHWWSATGSSTVYPGFIRLILNTGSVAVGSADRILGGSVRCLKDN